jgi:hypothetical protein
MKYNFVLFVMNFSWQQQKQKPGLKGLIWDLGAKNLPFYLIFVSWNCG